MKVLGFEDGEISSRLQSYAGACQPIYLLMLLCFNVYVIDFALKWMLTCHVSDSNHVAPT